MYTNDDVLCAYWDDTPRGWNEYIITQVRERKKNKKNLLAWQKLRGPQVLQQMLHTGSQGKQHTGTATHTTNKYVLA